MVRNKRIRDEPEGHLNLVARYYMLRTAFFAVIQKETEGIFQLFQTQG